MNIWWESLTNLQQIFALLAIPATLILLLQTLMLIFGMGHHGDGGGDAHEGDFNVDHHDGDGHAQGGHAHQSGHHDSGLRIFTVRAFVAFFTIFGWLGLVLTDGGLHNAAAIVISFLAGLAAMVGMAYFFKFALSLQSSGNIDIRNSLGKTATVYMPIPPKRTGKGKVTVVVQGRFTEVDAVTDSEAALKTGLEVVGVSITNQNVLCVTPIQEEP